MLALILGSADEVLGADWTGATSTSWFTAGNWSTAAVPGSATGVFINNPNANTPVIGSTGATASTVTLGLATGQTGTLTIDGGGLTTSTAVDPSVVVGDQGTGFLTIENGGKLTSGSGYAGFDPGGTGTVVVTGTGSQWSPSNFYVAADANATGTVTIEAGGKLAVGGNTSLAINSATASGTLTVTGAGSSFTSGGQLQIGGSGSGTVNVEDGATAIISGFTFVTYNPGSTGTLNVDGAGSLMKTQGGLYVGGNGAMNVTAGGTVDSTSGSLSFAGNAAVHVDGAGSLWQTGSLLLTNSGGGGLLLTDGGKTTSASANVFGSATITGAHSEWAIGSGLTLNGGTISVLAGGKLSSATAQIGNGSNGGTVTVSGKDPDGNASTWTVAGALTLTPFGGTTGTLEVKAGGQVSAGTLTTNANATITVDGAGSKLTVLGGPDGSASLSSTDSGSTSITVSNGGAVVVGNQWTGGLPSDFISSDIGGNVGSTTNVTVTGAGSSWSNPIGGMAVGESGNGFLTIADGGHVTTGFLSIGRLATSDSVLTVTGAGSLLTLTDGSHTFEVGTLGKGTLKVLAGGEVQTGGVNLTMGAFGGGHGEVLVDGIGSKLVTKGLSLGPFTAGKLTISSGGRVEATGVSTGENPGISGGQIIIDAGTLIASADLIVGANGGASLTASHGGMIEARSAFVGDFQGSNGVMTISGAGTSLTLSQDLYIAPIVGGSGPSGQGALTVDTGGRLAVDRDIVIASTAGTTGSLTVRNTGSSVGGKTLAIGGHNSAGGTGSLVLADGGAVSITGASRIFSAGTLQIGEGAAPGSFSAASLRDDGTLRFNHSGSLTFATPISGSGSITHTGSGLTVLTGTSTFAGTVTVDAGTLRVGDATPGSMSAATFVVNSGGTLGGTGSVGPTTISAGGTHAPGASIGTETVNGDYVNHGTLAIEVSPTAADQVAVVGAVDISGASLVLAEVSGTGWQQAQTYTIIDNDAADAVTGTFGTITDNLAFLDPEVVYDGGSGNDVILTITRNAVAFADLAETPNQLAAAQGLESLGLGDPLADAIIPLTITEAPAAFDQLSGEIYASLGSVAVNESRTPREAALDRLAAQLDAIADSEVQPGHQVWMRSVGDFSVARSDGNAASVSFGTGGFVVGGDTWVSGNLVIGAEAGVTTTMVSVPDRSSEATLDTAHFGIYGGASFDAWRIGFGAAVSAGNAHVVRRPAFTGFSEELESDSSLLTTQVFGEIGYDIVRGPGTLEPFAGLVLQHTAASSYAETGGIAALSGDRADLDAATVRLGLNARVDTRVAGRPAQGRLTLGVEDTFAPAPTATHAFDGGAAFTVAGAEPGARAVLETELSIELTDDVSLDLSYHGAFGQDGLRNGLAATLHGSF